MKTSKVVPTGQERTWPSGELIVSKTDPRGVIAYANETFIKVSYYDMAHVIGSPHNLIRHPGMPRGLYHLLWETISAGNEIFAYIDNLSADGANYWVLAHVTPTYDTSGKIVGYHSNRRLPERRPIDALRPVYQRMRAAESQHSNAAEAARAGSQRLKDDLAEQGLTYDQFIWGLIQGTTEKAAA